MQFIKPAKINLDERTEILKNVSIFSQTDPEVCREIAAAMTELTLKIEQTLFEKGDVGKDMFVIVEGAVRIHDGKYVFAILRTGQVFGEYSLLEADATSRSASATAVVKTQLLKLDQHAFYTLMSHRIEIVKGILKVLVKRARRQNYFEEKLNEQSVQLERQRDLINREKEKSEQLLLNILPAEIAEELKTRGRAEVRDYEMASVLFADIKGFTQASQVLPPARVVAVLEVYFYEFDEIISRHGIEKIKTIGDAYMCASGIPRTDPANPIKLVLAALEMQHFMKEYNATLPKDVASQIPVWELRVGINTGPLIAGVIGKMKFIYDVWGDTVNTASRMESAGEVNRVNISKATYEYVKDIFECEHRGKISAKGKGMVDMYFVNGLLPKYQKRKSPIHPNAAYRKYLEKNFK